MILPHAFSLHLTLSLATETKIFVSPAIDNGLLNARVQRLKLKPPVGRDEDLEMRRQNGIPAKKSAINTALALPRMLDGHRYA